MSAVTRSQVLAYRIAVQGLHREVDEPTALAVLDLGVQDSPPGAAAQAIGARLPDEGAAPGVQERNDLVTTWTLRGAPHVIRTRDLHRLARALWPRSDEDALQRLDTSAVNVRAMDLGAHDVLRMVAARFAAAIDGPTTKGDISTAVSRGLDPALLVDCRVCRTTHIVETLFRMAALPSGAVIVNPGRRGVAFDLVPDWPGPPDHAQGTDAVVTAYLHLLGPATRADVAAFLGTREAHLDDVWPDGLDEVEVEGRPAFVEPRDHDTLRSPPAPPAVLLLPPSDPLLQARDRDLLVPDRAHRDALFPALGRPGALVVDGDIIGTWRARKASTKRLDISVAPFRRLPKARHGGLEHEAARIAASRGHADVRLTVEA